MQTEITDFTTKGDSTPIKGSIGIDSPVLRTLNSFEPHSDK